MSTSTTTRGRLGRTVLAITALASLGVSAGAVSASDHVPGDAPTDWPEKVQKRANRAATYCGNPAAAAAAGYNVIVGSGVINGTPGRDLILASGVSDVVRAGAGSDIVCAFGRGDRVRGGRGNDVIFGQRGNDRLLGERGNDIIIGGPGVDTCSGGPGTDFIDC